MSTSAIPGAMAALVDILTAALPDVAVFDGSSVADDSMPDCVWVGWHPDEQDAARFVQSFNAAGARTRDEAFQIFCYLESWSGDTDMPARRTQAFALLAAVETALRSTAADPAKANLGGTVLWAELTTGSLRPIQDDKGLRAGIPFVISCRARI